MSEVKPKPKRVLSVDHLAKLQIARQKAQEAKIKNMEIRKIVKENEKLEKNEEINEIIKKK